MNPADILSQLKQRLEDHDQYEERVDKRLEALEELEALFWEKHHVLPNMDDLVKIGEVGLNQIEEDYGDYGDYPTAYFDNNGEIDVFVMEKCIWSPDGEIKEGLVFGKEQDKNIFGEMLLSFERPQAPLDAQVFGVKDRVGDSDMAIICCWTKARIPH